MPVMTTPAAEITDAAAYTQAVQDALGAAAAHYTGRLRHRFG